MNELLEQLQIKMEAFQKDAALRKRKQGSRPACPLCITRNGTAAEAVQETFVGGFEKIKSKTLRGCHSSAMTK